MNFIKYIWLYFQEWPKIIIIEDEKDFEKLNDSVYRRYIEFIFQIRKAWVKHYIIKK